MFLVSNDPNLDFAGLSSRYGLQRAAVGGFQLLFASNLGRISEADGSFQFAYGVHRPSGDGSFEGCFFFISIDPSSAEAEFYSDPFNLGSFSYLNGEHLTIFNDVVFLKFLPLKKVNREAARSFVSEGYFPNSQTIFENCSMSQAGVRYIWSAAGGLRKMQAEASLKVDLDSNAGIPQKFFEIVKTNCAFLIERFQIKKFLLSGGSDSRLLLASLLELRPNNVTAVLQKTWNPNSAVDCQIAEDLCRSYGFPYEIENASEMINPTTPSIQKFLDYRPYDHSYLTGFHGTEFLGRAISWFSMSGSFMSSIYEGIPGTLFHFPRLLGSRGFFTPYRDSYFLKFLSSLPQDYLGNYRLQIETFKEVLPQLAAFGFHSEITKYDADLKKPVAELLPPPKFDPSRHQSKIDSTARSFGLDIRSDAAGYLEKMRILNLHFLMDDLTRQPEAQ